MTKIIPLISLTMCLGACGGGGSSSTGGGDSGPLIGVWQEKAQLTCGTNAEVAPERPIDKLEFREDGGMTVTWSATEAYTGTFQYFDDGRITLSLGLEGSTYVPLVLDPIGTVKVDGSSLTLQSIWLGIPKGSTAMPNCGHRFASVM